MSRGRAWSDLHCKWWPRLGVRYYYCCWHLLPAVLVQTRGRIFGQAPPTMLIYANCTTTIRTAQGNRASFIAIHPCMHDMKAHTLPALSFKHHKKPLQSSCVLVPISSAIFIRLWHHCFLMFPIKFQRVLIMTSVAPQESP